MKWRKLLELSTSSSPPKSAGLRFIANRRTAFEALENRRLFAVDTAATGDGEVAICDFLPTDDLANEQVELRTLQFDVAVKEEVIEFEMVDDMASIEPTKIMVMTFRGDEISEELRAPTDATSDVEIEPSLMFMTGAVRDVEGVQFRTLSLEEIPVATSDVADEFVGEDDLIFYTLGPGSDGDATSADESLAPEDVPIVISNVADEFVSDDELIYYTMGPDSEMDSTSADKFLAPEDVNGDGNVTALDMLLVINALNNYGSIPSSQESAASPLSSSVGNWDINRDGHVTPLDALLLTNYFNSGTSVTEVESPQGSSAAPAEARLRHDALDADAPLIEELGDEFWELV